MKNNITQTTLTHLSQLQPLAADVMQTFTWYFVKIYWHHREQLRSQLPAATAESTIRREIEQQQLTPFLDHLDQLISIQDNKRVAKPIPALTHHNLLAFLETRLAALTIIAQILAQPAAANLSIPLWQHSTTQLAQKIQQLQRQFLRCQHELPLQLRIRLQRDCYYFTCSLPLAQSITLHQCQDIIRFDHLPTGTVLQITDSPKLSLYINHCQLSQLTVNGHLNKLIIQHSAIQQLDITATIDNIQLLKDSQATLQIKHSNLRDVTVEQSKAWLQLSQATQLQHLIMGSQSIVQLSCQQSQINQLQSSGYLQGRISESQLTTVDLTHCDCAYFTLLDSRLHNLIDPSQGGYQRIAKKGRLLAYYASQDLTPTEPSILNVTGSETQTPTIQHMCSLLQPDALQNYLQLTFTTPYCSQAYQSHKRQLLAKQMHHWGLFLLSHSINPLRCYWQSFCWQYHSIYHWLDQDEQLSQRILNLSFKTHYRKQLESGLASETTTHTAFSLLLTDNIIKEHRYQPKQKAQYTDSKQQITVLLDVLFCLRGYRSIQAGDNKQLAVRQLITNYLPVIQNLLLTQQEKIAILRERLLVFRTLNRKKITSGHMLRFVLQTSIALLTIQLELMASAAPALAALQPILDQYSDNPAVSKIRSQLNNQLKSQPSACAIYQTLQTMQRTPRLPTALKTALSRSNPCQTLQTTYNRAHHLSVILRECKHILDNYRPFFSWFGPGRKKRACIRYLALFIHSDRKTLQQRFLALQHKLDYLRHIVTETNAHSRQAILIRSVPLWRSRTRRYRGYQATLERVQHVLDRHNEAKPSTSHIVSIDIGQTLLAQSQRRFFQTYQQRSQPCSPTVSTS